MAVVILDAKAMREEIQRFWPEGADPEVSPAHILSIAAASWIEYQASEGQGPESRDIIILNLEDHFGKQDNDVWFALTQSTYLMVDSFIHAAVDMTRSTGVAYAGNVADGIVIRIYTR